MNFTFKGAETGRTLIQLSAPFKVCGSRADFEKLYHEIGNFFGNFRLSMYGEALPSGYSEIEVRDHAEEAFRNFRENPPPLEPAPTMRPIGATAFVAAEPTPYIYGGEFAAPAVGAEDTPSPAPSGEPRLTPGSETLTDDDIPF